MTWLLTIWNAIHVGRTSIAPQLKPFFCPDKNNFQTKNYLGVDVSKGPQKAKKAQNASKTQSGQKLPKMSEASGCINLIWFVGRFLNVTDPISKTLDMPCLTCYLPPPQRTANSSRLRLHNELYYNVRLQRWLQLKHGALQNICTACTISLLLTTYGVPTGPLLRRSH